MKKSIQSKAVRIKEIRREGGNTSGIESDVRELLDFVKSAEAMMDAQDKVFRYLMRVHNTEMARLGDIVWDMMKANKVLSDCFDSANKGEKLFGNMLYSKIQNQGA